MDCCGAVVQEKGSLEFCTAAVGQCLMQDTPVHCLVNATFNYI